jgi:DNA-directed RNA polymerase subunit RPC12/RpoP
MNINFTVVCDTCGTPTNIRFGMSNRDHQPVGFACQSCGSRIDIELNTNRMEVSGASKIESDKPFDADTNFVDLHLDFPVSFEPYQPGQTPFIRAMMRVGEDAMKIHGWRLRHLETWAPKARYFKTILKLYAKAKQTPFKLNIKRQFDIEVDSDRPEDINAALYKLIALMMAPFELPGQSADAVDVTSKALFDIADKHREALDGFVDSLVSSGFLKNLQTDILEIYPRIVDAELVLRPALFLDFDADYANNPVPLRVSTSDFEALRDLYKDIAEIIARELILVAGINNLQKRGNADQFESRLSKDGKPLHPKSISEFADTPSGRKREFIDQTWHESLEDAGDNKIRNAIAHYKTEYDEINQEISFYPKKEGIEQNKPENAYFIEFIRRLIQSYREMHRLHHVVKSIYYYHYLIVEKQDAV